MCLLLGYKVLSSSWAGPKIIENCEECMEKKVLIRIYCHSQSACKTAQQSCSYLVLLRLDFSSHIYKSLPSGSIVRIMLGRAWCVLPSATCVPGVVDGSLLCFWHERLTCKRGPLYNLTISLQAVHAGPFSQLLPVSWKRLEYNICAALDI